jgi:hypothetical protein
MAALGSRAPGFTSGATTIAITTSPYGPTSLLSKSNAVIASTLVPWCGSTGSRCDGRMRRAFSVGNSKKPLIAFLKE